MCSNCCHTHGIQADYFFVGDESSPFTASSDGDPILTRPFIDATTGLPAEELDRRARHRGGTHQYQ